MRTYLIAGPYSDHPIAGLDSMIALAPPGLFKHNADGTKNLIVNYLAPYLRKLGNDAAQALGEGLHHAEWVITTDPDTVRTRGLIHDCVSCQAGVDQALTALREHPATDLLVGTLFWAGPPASHLGDGDDQRAAGQPPEADQ